MLLLRTWSGSHPQNKRATLFPIQYRENAAGCAPIVALFKRSPVPPPLSHLPPYPNPLPLFSSAMVSAIRLFTASLLFGAAALAAPSRPRHVPKNAHEEGFVLRATRRDGFAATRSSSMSKRAVAKRCASRSSTSSLSSPTTAPGGVGALPTGTTTTTSYTTSTTVDSGNGGGDGGGNDQKPANWPTKTQSGPMYSATVASPSDPYLRSISEVSIVGTHYTSSCRLCLCIRSSVFRFSNRLSTLTALRTIIRRTQVI